MKFDNKMLMLLLPAIMGKKCGNAEMMQLFCSVLNKNTHEDRCKCGEKPQEETCDCEKKPMDSNKLMLEMMTKLLNNNK